MSTGKQLSALLLLTTALTFPGVAFAQGTAGEANSGAEGMAPADDAATAYDSLAAEALADETEDQPEISIPGGGGEILVTGRRVRDVTRSSTQVVSVLSTEQIARTGEGDIAGALGRVTGLSVQGQGFVYVRGLGDRYSLAMLNGLPLPSPQPLSRVVPLDIFPTNIIASSLVQKTYSANFPGEFGGGVINLTTRAVPDETFLTVSAGVSGDTETTFQNGISYYGSDYDWFGFDNGTRSPAPALQSFLDSGEVMSDLTLDQQKAIGKELGNPNLVLTQKIGKLPANFSGGLTAGTATDVGDDGRLGIVATASISNKWRNRFITQQTAINTDLALDNDFYNVVTDNRILVNGLVGVGLELGEHRFRWTNLFIRDSVKQARLGFGEDYQSGYSKQVQDTAWYERQLFDSQLVTELRFGDLSLDLRGGYARTDRNAPYEYSFEYVRTNNANDPLGNMFINVMDRQRGNASVVFSDLKEELWFGGADLSYPLADWLTATVGYAYSDTDRYSERREFLFDAPTSFEDGVGAFRPDLLLGDAVIDYYDIGLIETTTADPAFAAALKIQAGYGKAQVTPMDGVTLDIGVRYETADQTVSPVDLFDTGNGSTAATALSNDYWLPAATLTWELTDSLQFRASASRTIARPQFRELIYQTYYDPETNRQFNGNPYLVDSKLLNLESRLEYYLGGGDKVSLAGFYKKIDNPIEAYSSFSDNDQLTSFANAPQATLYGAEFDLQVTKDLYDWGGFFASKQLVTVANYTYTQSKISVGANDLTRVYPGGDRPATDYFVDGVPLTGQSDHLVNFQLSLEDTDRLQQLTALLSYASTRVTSRGTSGLPDILEDPGFRLDLVYRQGVDLFGVETEWKFEARNLTGENHEEYQATEDNRIEVNTYDIGRTFALSVSLKF